MLWLVFIIVGLFLLYIAYKADSEVMYCNKCRRFIQTSYIIVGGTGVVSMFVFGCLFIHWIEIHWTGFWSSYHTWLF